MSARYVVGIDLGTTNSAVAYAEVPKEAHVAAQIEHFPIPQLVAPGTVEPRPTLPSFLYLPAPAELRREQLALPWDDGSDALARGFVGELARSHGAQVPSRLVASAKSWLSHAGVDRLADLLPWGAPAEVPRVSPVAASARYLEHLRRAWHAAHPEAPLGEQEVLLTVPASFDAVARELTVRAATLAGLPQVTLLEEPQAAFYSWLGQSGDRWRRQLGVGDMVLVCDIGGGTTDFSLIAVTEEKGTLLLERVAVGDHILLGGDNMDLALAHSVRARLEAEGHRLDEWQLASLLHSCRAAKEQLFGDASLESAPVVVLGRGSKVIGGSIRAALLRTDVEALLGEGFFPPAALGERAKRGRGVGLRELGLPFAADPAVTRHLSTFLSAAPGSSGAAARATYVLFNGGVMKAAPLRQRVLQALDRWNGSPGAAVTMLTGTDLELAVAHGAAYYGLVRRGRGVRIRGGTARAYYVGIESAAPAVPGVERPLRAVCVAPFGMEEGSEAEVQDQEFGLVVGEPAEFRLLASSTRPADQVGAALEDASAAGLKELSPIATQLGEGGLRDGRVVPVKLRSRVTEVGTLELYCVATAGEGRWKLEYDVREANG